MKDIVKSKSECSFGRMVRSVGRLERERVEIGARVDMGKYRQERKSLFRILEILFRFEIGQKLTGSEEVQVF